ncbi:hypothetical protein M413DRAFT_13641 [Hebeloma cylindrosporum]|uniref:Uncharacterized protein n=1 Tax=Hebeloma cylindrosporum TaxID=76867 RepID=A0A0C3BXR5_HEBCY|nr:hypothetical protein M413DRAFT_13641 [Hebeloma cylindrosporum h7]
MFKDYWSSFWTRPATIGSDRTISSVHDDEEWNARQEGVARARPNMEGGDSIILREASRKRGRHMVGGFDVIGENEGDVEDRSEEQRRKGKELREQIQALKAEKEGLEQRLRSAQEDAIGARENVETSFQQLKALEHHRNSIIEQLNAARNEASMRQQEAERLIFELEARARAQEGEVRSLREQLKEAEEKQVQVGKLLEVRTADLKGVQTFLTTADLHSGSEIMAMVESLNDEIFQAAAFMAELLESEQATGWRDRRTNIRKYHQHLLEARQQTGEELFTHIDVKYRDLRSHPLPLQCAIQGILTAWCIQRIQSFSAGAFGDNLQRLYGLIRESEVQAISGRWRAITSTQLQAVEGESNVNAMVETIVGLMCVAGWPPLSPQAQKALGSVQNKVSTIEKKSTELKKAVKQDVTTTDMEVFLATPGALFTEEMEDVDTESEGVGNSGSGSTGPEKRILCTVGMGLRKTTRKKDGAGPLETQIDLLLKPKVTLPSVLLDSEKGVGGVRNR